MAKAASPAGLRCPAREDGAQLTDERWRVLEQLGLAHLATACAGCRSAR